MTGNGNEPDVRKVGYDSVRTFLIPSVEDRVDYASALGRVVTRRGHDVVLLDIGLPGPDGYEVARRIRDHLWGHRMTIVLWGHRMTIVALTLILILAFRFLNA